jgi:hypothetical protein
VAEAISDNVQFTPEIVQAVKNVRAAKLFQGTLAERQEKFRTFHAAMCKAMDVSIELKFKPGRKLSAYRLTHKTGTLIGRLSLVTYFYIMSHAAQYDFNGQMTFSINLFRKYFPRSFARCEQQGLYLVHPKKS